MKKFINICRKTQKELKAWLPKELKKLGYTVIQEDGFIYAPGKIPVLLTAHMDTVHKEPVKTVVVNDGIISSPQGIGGDDRCGIYMILKLAQKHHCSILFCEDEEIGGIGSDKFSRSAYRKDLESLHYLIELDRANKNDAVFYDCDNPEFTEWITTTTKTVEAHGSFSDICNLSPVCKIASVNFSCGYYKAHTTSEYVVFDEMLRMIDVVDELLAVESKQFEFIEKKYAFGNSWYNDDYWRTYYGYTSKPKQTKVIDDEITLWVNYMEKDTEDEDFVNGSSRNACWGKFFQNHPNVCFNDVLDYQFDYNDDTYMY